MNEQQEQSKLGGYEGIGIAMIWALTLQLPLRCGIGRNVLGVYAGVGMMAVFCVGGLYQSLPVLCWSGVYFISILFHRVAVVRRRLKGTEPHSQYRGYPWFGVLLGRKFDEVKVKAVIEPFFICLLGILSAPAGQAAFVYFFGGAACMFISTMWTEMQHRKRVDDTRDAMIEGQLYRPVFNRRRW